MGETEGPTPPAAGSDREPGALTRDLVVALRQAAGRDEAVTATLELVCARLSASAGLAWIREPGGRWRLLRAVGDRSLTAGVLAREPEPEGDGAGVVRREHDDGTTVRVGVASWQGEPAAVLCFHGSAASPASSPEIEGLLEPVAELLGTVLDRLAERGLLEEIQRVAKVGSWEWHAASDTVWLSEQMYRNLGTDPERFDHTVAGYLARVHPEDRSVLRRQLGEAAAADGWSTVHRVVTEEGRIHVLEGHAQVTRDRHGVVVRLWGTGQDITERRQLEHELARRAERDGLTDLLDRPAFVDRLQRAMDEHRDRPDAVVVALVDIEDVRALNRQFGWAHGDRVLVAVAERLRRGLPDAVAAARLTDDTFAVRFDQPGGADDLDALGERIATLFDPADPLTPDTPPVVVRVGLAAGQTGVRSADELLRACGIALDGVAGRGGARWQAFDSVTHGRALQQLALESDLRRAVEQGKIELAYQPVLELGSGRVTGVEALARWHRADHGPVSPATFIPLAERLGLIHDLGVQVLERACRQLQAWTRLHPDAGDWHVAVNLAAAQLDDPDLIEIVEDVLRDSGLAHDRLVLEVTETSLSHDTPGALARLFELRRRGVRVAIDDFGTGYSSLSRLRELPFDILKVDRAFIQGIVSRAEESPILQALFFMTQGLALDVVAEGVETPMQLAALRAHGCGFAQGFLFSRPLAPEEVEPLFAGPVPWDVTQLATEVTKPARSPLQQLLNGLVDAGGGAADDTLHQLLSVLASLTGLDSVYLTRIDLDDDVQEVLAAANSGSPIIEAGLRVPWSQTLCRRAVADGRQVVRDVTGTYPDSDAADRWGIRTYLGVQVRGSKGGLRGTLCGVTRRVTDVPVETVEALQWAARLLADPVEGRGISRPH